MNKGKIAIMAAGNMHYSVKVIIEDAGYGITPVDKEGPFSPTRYPITMSLDVEPILEPCKQPGAFSSKHCRSEAYYSKRIAKRRNKNKNKKTHK